MMIHVIGVVDQRTPRVISRKTNVVKLTVSKGLAVVASHTARLACEQRKATFGRFGYRRLIALNPIIKVRPARDQRAFECRKACLNGPRTDTLLWKQSVKPASVAASLELRSANHL